MLLLMNLRTPGSGGVLESLLNGLGRTASSGDDWTLEGVSEAQLAEALDAMQRGDIEYVILEHGDDFLQTAGEGDGPYALEFNSAGNMEEIRGGADATTMRAALFAYRRGDPAWRTGTWSKM
jgi:hypothetical protein